MPSANGFKAPASDTLNILRNLFREIPIAQLHSEQQAAPLTLLAGRPVAAFCGLGNPEAFRRTLLGLGAAVGAFRTFPDHHAYGREDVDALRDWLREQPPDALAVTTQKDLVKLRVPQLGGRPLWAVRVRLDVVAGRAGLEQKLRSVAPAT